MEAFYEGLVAETQHFVILAPLCSENLTFEGPRVLSWSHLGSKIAPKCALGGHVGPTWSTRWRLGGFEGLLGSFGSALGAHFGRFLGVSGRPCVPASGCRGARRRGGRLTPPSADLGLDFYLKRPATSGGGAADSIRFAAPGGPTNMHQCCMKL